MEITINELKATCQKSSCVAPTTADRQQHSSADYNFQCFNSNALYSNKKPVRFILLDFLLSNEIQRITNFFKQKLNGILCLHKRNYRLILADKTDWIYIEFLNSDNSQGSVHTSDLLLQRNTDSKCYLKINHLLKELTISTFNLCIERINLSQNRDETSEKVIFYLQADLSQCYVNLKEQFELKLGELNEDLSISLLKTQELIRMFKCKQVNSSVVDISDIIDETLEENYEDEVADMADSQTLYKLDLNRHRLSDYFYLIRVLNKGPVQSMARSTLQGFIKFGFVYSILLLVIFFLLSNRKIKGKHQSGNVSTRRRGSE